MTTTDLATPDDIAALMGIERGEGFEHLVERWSVARHAAEMAAPGSRYLAARSASREVQGFALLQGLDDPQGCASLRRIAVAQPGRGLGTTLLDATLSSAFGEAAVHRLQLLVYPENARARRLYARAGFVEEGLLRDVSLQPDGPRRSMLVASLLRPDWAARRG